MKVNSPEATAINNEYRKQRGLPPWGSMGGLMDVEPVRISDDDDEPELKPVPEDVLRETIRRVHEIAEEER